MQQPLMDYKYMSQICIKTFIALETGLSGHFAGWNKGSPEREERHLIQHRAFNFIEIFGAPQNISN
jgi:hypothetical protein